MTTAPWFFLHDEPSDRRVRLASDELEHALKVLRLRPGDAAVGTDGKGGLWPLRLVASEHDKPVFERDGEPTRVPPPGEMGSSLPWIELLVSLPRAGRAEEMLDRLVQLGLAALRPLNTERTQGFARELSPARMARLERVARSACKQSRRAWLPVFLPPVEIAGLVRLPPASETFALSPSASQTVLGQALSAKPGTRAAPWRVIVGAEGGLTEREQAQMTLLGARAVSLGPSILRIETAAEAALAVLVQAAATGSIGAGASAQS